MFDKPLGIEVSGVWDTGHMEIPNTVIETENGL
jgi:hypothetical protein